MVMLVMLVTCERLGSSCQQMHTLPCLHLLLSGAMQLVQAVPARHSEFLLSAPTTFEAAASRQCTGLCELDCLVASGERWFKFVVLASSKLMVDMTFAKSYVDMAFEC